jgi:hypothetical protein
LHDLLKRDGFQWTSHDTTAFNTLKDKLSATPVMALPNFQLPFTLEIDASASGLAVVLMQQGRPIAFFSQALVPKTSAQSTYHKEALAILLALKRWRHYLLGSQVIIKTDQQSLRYKLTQRLAEGIKHNLLMKLLDFNYTTEYKKGAEIEWLMHSQERIVKFQLYPLQPQLGYQTLKIATFMIHISLPS